ncbi:MAG TPA: SDR family NAD(P)-dependent oxidoreductase, partial [Gammaproteobacteria bacterium]
MLNQDIALVTGATRGIGKAISLALGRAGATVVGTATKPEGAEQFSAYLKGDGVKGKGMVL